MSAPDLSFEYATLQLMPSAAAEDCLSVGVVLHARAAEYLDLLVAFEPVLWQARLPGLDVVMAERALRDLVSICQGGASGGPIGLLPPGERFHWMTAPRSAVIRPSEVRGGVCRDPRRTLERLFALSLGPREVS